MDNEKNVSQGAGEQRAQSVKKTRQKNYVLDLRIHSPESLGYLGIDGLDTAPALIKLAETKKLDVIAITDLFSGNFIDQIKHAAKGSSVKVLPGTELKCKVGRCSDVIITCLFPEAATTADITALLKELHVLPNFQQNLNFTLEQPFSQIIATVEAAGGITFPSRMDKTPHQLEVVPQLVEMFGYRSFDLAYSDSSRFFKIRWPKMKFNLFSFSNAHALAQVGSRVAKVKLPSPGFPGIETLLKRESQTV